MKGELVLIDNMCSNDSEFSLPYTTHDFGLTVYVDDEKTLEKQLKNRSCFDSCMKEIRDFRIVIDEENEDEEKQIQYIEEHFDNLLDSIEYIHFLFQNKTVKDYIQANPIILTKKIVLNEVLDITDYNKLIILMNEYVDMIDKIYVSFTGNHDYISLKDCYKTMNIIKKQADAIASLGMSPLETIMYVYDQVRNRVYTSEDKDETTYTSRDLSQVLLGDKIVCLGYANIFNTLLNYLGIKSKVVYLDSKNTFKLSQGHARNIIYIEDPKYHIDGVYYFDPTWNSKRNENDNSYLYEYDCFAKTKTYMEERDAYRYIDKQCPLYSAHLYEDIKNIVESGDITQLYKYASTIKYMQRMVNETEVLDAASVHPILSQCHHFDADKFLKRFKTVIEKFEQEIPAETMIKLLRNVRKFEYYQNSEWYLYSVNDIYRTLVMSKWNFQKDHLSGEEKLICAILGKDYLDNKPKDIKTNFINYIQEIKLFKTIEQIKLTKVLQKTLHKKQQSVH